MELIFRFKLHLLTISEDERYQYDSYEGAAVGEDFTGTDDFRTFFSDTSSRNGFSGNGSERTGVESKPLPRKKGGRTEDEFVDFPITLEELYKGKVVKFTSHRNKLCKLCQGTGGRLRAKPLTCKKCQGSGNGTKPHPLSPGVVINRLVACARCRGLGITYREKDKCKHCKGSGTGDETKILEAYFPRGAQDGHQVILEGEADEEYGKTPGAVIIEVHQQAHDVFERKNNDLYATIQITLAEAVCGFSRTALKHLDGRGIRITTPHGTVIRPDEVIKIAGEGMPIPRTDTAGDLYLNIEILFPKDGWCRETSELRKIRHILPMLPQSSQDINIPQNQIDDVEYSIEKRENVRRLFYISTTLLTKTISCPTTLTMATRIIQRLLLKVARLSNK